MSRPTVLLPRGSTSVRLLQPDVDFMKNMALRLGTVNAGFAELVSDARTLYGLPEAARLVLEADREAAGIPTQREYIVHLLMARFRERVLAERPARDSAPHRRHG